MTGQPFRAYRQPEQPHSVTAAQVGADPAGSAEAVRAALTTQMGEMSTAISAASFIKLRALTVSPAVHQVDVDVQDIDLTQYSYLVIIPRLTVAGNSLGRIYMRINGNAEEVYSSISGDQTYLGSFFGTEGFNFYQVNLFEVNRRITMTDLYVNGDAKASLSGSYASRGSLPAESMKVINFSAQYTGDLIEEGGTIHIYGVKR